MATGVFSEEGRGKSLKKYTMSRGFSSARTHQIWNGELSRAGSLIGQTANRYR